MYKGRQVRVAKPCQPVAANTLLVAPYEHIVSSTGAKSTVVGSTGANSDVLLAPVPVVH